MSAPGHKRTNVTHQIIPQVVRLHLVYRFALCDRHIHRINQEFDFQSHLHCPADDAPEVTILLGSIDSIVEKPLSVRAVTDEHHCLRYVKFRNTFGVHVNVVLITVKRHQMRNVTERAYINRDGL